MQKGLLSVFIPLVFASELGFSAGLLVDASKSSREATERPQHSQPKNTTNHSKNVAIKNSNKQNDANQNNANQNNANNHRTEGEKKIEVQAESGSNENLNQPGIDYTVAVHIVQTAETNSTPIPPPARENPSETGSDTDAKNDLKSSPKKIAKSEETDFDELESLLLSVSEANRLIEKAPASQLILQRRARADLTHLDKALRSRGYYAAQLDYQIESSKNPWLLTFRVELGPRYRVNRVELMFPQTLSTKPELPDLDSIGLAEKSWADARHIIKAKEQLVSALKRQGYAYARIESEHFWIDRKTAGMDIRFDMIPGPKVYLNRVEFSGNESIHPDFLQSLIPWQGETLYHPKLLNQASQIFSETDLFSTVRIELPDDYQSAQSQAISSSENNYQAITRITLKERKHRTIKGRIAFETDTGVAISTQWIHRNLFGGGEKLSVEGAWSSVGPMLEALYRKPYFLSHQQAFVAGLALKNEDTDAYKSSSFNLWGGIERTLRPGMDITLGLGFNFSDIKDKSLTDEEELGSQPIDDSENFALLYLPAKFNWNFSNDLFEPDQGGKLLLEGSPFVDLKSDLRFAKLYARYIHYQRVTQRVVFAGRVAVGNIFGADVSELPADERFFAGGGGSVRGYGYQLASPLDKDGDPQGGNALFELALESRLSFGHNVGGVAFIDAGAAYEKHLFDASNDLRYGAGVGVRYTSPIGPLRADLAFPLDRRKEVDDAFHLYLSIGHAF